MKAEKWDQIKDLFNSALERQPAERSQFLREACRGDDALRAEVESLISSHDQGSTFIEKPAAELASDAVQEGQRIGSYQVIREIGSGGMAVVYLAVRADDQYRKRVAIKVVKKGADLDEIPRRFRNERQTLAALDHANIVRLLDGGGTDDGVPYLVMDYVEGTPITEYCDSHRLSIDERLELFRTVCGAVHYAHQNLVIHRDLKPGNILVTADGIPKLLDFGIAKLLNPEFSAQTLLVTQADLRLMTPEYASPEQVRGQPITTATDVYSLGVLLYELLTGYRPYRLKDQSLHEIERAICEVEPEKPSTVVTHGSEISSPDGTTQTGLTPELVSQTREGRPEKLRRRLLGDLDNVVLMALRKEPQRRYSSVEQFSQDIRRHLEGLPVTARPATFRYRASKFMHRHTAGVSAAAAVLLILLGGIAVTAREARIARVEKARADRRFNDVRHLANSFLFEFHDAITDLPGSTAARQLVVKRALEYLEDLAREPGADQGLQLELAMAYQRVGDVQGNPNISNLGDSPGALESYRKALAIRQAVVAADSKNTQAQSDLGVTYERIGDILRRTKGPGEALESYQRNLSINEALSAADPRNAKIRRNLSVIHNKLGHVLENAGELDDALKHYNKSLELAEPLAAEDPTGLTPRTDLAICYDNIGDILVRKGDLEGALNNYQKKQAIFEDLLASNSQSRFLRKGLVVSYVNMGDAFAKLESWGAAAESYRKAVAFAERLAREDVKNATAQDDLGTSYASLATALAKAGNKKEGLEYHRKALGVFEMLAARDPANTDFQLEHAEELVDTAILLAGTGQNEEARRLTRRGLAVLKVQAEQAEATIEALRAAAMALLTCQPADLRDPPQALRFAERAVQKTNASEPGILSILAQVYFKTGDPAKAVETEQKALLLLPPSSEKGSSAARKPYETDLANFQKAAHRH